MKIDMDEYLSEVKASIKKTGYVSAKEKDRIALNLGATVDDIKMHGAMYCIDERIEDVPEFIEDEYQRKKSGRI